MKTAERELARMLRQAEGLSVKEIAQRLGVSRSSASVWRDVPLTTEQQATLLARNPAYNGQRAGASSNAARARARHLSYQDEGRALAREAGAMYAAGCMLFWAEGSRLDHAVQLTNSDPELMRFFADFLRRSSTCPTRSSASHAMSSRKTRSVCRNSRTSGWTSFACLARH